MDSVLFHTFVYLLAAVILVPLAKRLGLGSVLGYLLAGVVIGPHVLDLIGQVSGDIMHFAEFGVVMMLFLVGLELQPTLLWRLRTRLFGLGSLQVVGTAIVIMGVALAFGARWQSGLATGLILALSSTAIVLQSLQERGQLKTEGGQASFSVLLFQDLAVIPILALLPLLAENQEGRAVVHPVSGLAALPGWQQAAITIAAVAGVVLVGLYLVNPLLRAVARTRLREIFTVAALLLVVGVALAMRRVGLSPALGTFLGGVVLANSEYRHELEADVEPFKGLLMGLFFMSVGAEIDFPLMRDQPGLIAALVGGLLIIKFVVLFVLARVFKLPRPDGMLFAFALAQGGEFAFVLLSFVVDHRVLNSVEAAPLVVSVALSMGLTPVLFVINEKWVQPRFAREKKLPPADSINEENPVIIAGFGRFGHVVGRLLRASAVGTTVLDLDADQVAIVRRLGLKVFYGDATRLELLHAAGADRAKAIVIAIDDEVKSIQLVETVQKHFPHLQIFARAVGRVHAYEFQRRGVERFYRETLGSSLELGAHVLTTLGMPAVEAERAAQIFKFHDEAAVRELAQYWENDDKYFSEARKHIEAFEQMFAADQAARHLPMNSGPEPLPVAKIE
jgi:monovalent cation:proton antiporter-2 (CPA2) family protein